VSTTTIVILVAIVVLLAVVASVLAVRSRRRRAQASEQLGLPPLGALSGEPIDTVTASRAVSEDARSRSGDTRSVPSEAGRAKPQPDQ
jgi:hypothetical protein